MKLGDITREVVEKVVALCPDCGFTDVSIDKPLFSCYSDSPSFVTYQARLEGTSLTESDHFISLIEQWVMGGASVIVSGVLMKMDSKCLVEISDLSEDECTMKPIAIVPTLISRYTAVVNTEPKPSVQDPTGKPSHFTTTLGVMIVVVIIAVAVLTTIIIITVLVLKNRQAQYSLRNLAILYVASKYICIFRFHSFACRSGARGNTIKTTSNDAYEEIKQGGGGGGGAVRGGRRGGEAYEMVDITPTVTTPTKISLTSAADLEGMYETPFASSEALPAMPPLPETNEEEDGIYEVIPGDK